MAKLLLKSGRTIVQGTFVKNTPDKLTEVIQNYDEIYALFSGTSFESFFKE